MATRKPRRFFNGGVTADELEAANASEDPIASLNAQKGWTGTEEVAQPAAPARKQSFKEAFAEARRGGEKTFEWNGKKYTTEMAGTPKPAAKVTDTGDETARLKARAPAPVAKQKYETPFDRSRREDREAGRDIGSIAGRIKERIMGSGDRGQSRILRDVRPGATNPKTMLPTGMKKGGSVSKASSRADGIAQRGKTRGKMI